jgi:hypothetical protein
MIEPAAAVLAAERATGAGLALLLQMGGLINVGLRASFRISTRSYDAGVPLPVPVVRGHPRSPSGTGS